MITSSTNQTQKCQICGDVSCGRNLNVFTCISCKFFLIRNSSKIEILQCSKSNNCTINLQTRKSCPKCRLTKCFAVGMSNRTKNKDSNNLSTKIDLIFESLIRENVDKIICLEFSQTLEQKRNKTNITNLSSYEMSLIQDLQSSMNVFVDENSLPLSGEVTNMVDIFNWPERYSKHIVKFCKGLAAFRLLNKEDQLILLKPFFMEILVIRVAFMYDPIKNGYRILTDESANGTVFINFGKSNTNFKCQKAVDENSDYVKGLNLEMENDPTIRNLLIAQILFRNCSGLHSIEFVSYHYFIYLRLLKRYLAQKYQSHQQAEKKFVLLQKFVKNLARFNQNHTQMIEELEVEQLSGWLTELYLHAAS